MHPRGARSANVVTDTPVVLYELPTQGLARLNVEQPGLEAKLLRNLAAALSFRLRNLNNTVLELES